MSAAAKLAQCGKRVRDLMDRLDQYREHWTNKQIECEELQRRLAVVSGALRERLGAAGLPVDLPGRLVGTHHPLRRGSAAAEEDCHREQRVCNWAHHGASSPT